MLIVVLGVDGSGKTTLAKMISEELDAIYKYGGHNLQNRNYLLMEKFIKKEKFNFFQKILRRILIIINDFLEFNFLKKDKIFVYDRYIYDFYVQTKGQRRHFFYKNLIYFFKKPDILIFLTGDPYKIYERKKEIPVKEIQKMIKDYKNLFIKLNIDYLEIDTTALSKEDALLQIKNYIERKIKVEKI